ncbi:hypothetical protein [Lysobacter sp. GCM10012299]|uniref:hypothetical protein n=1 Tax=Lysobacter sp. GCM10012299 TaxID=3317333 RepID=UPI0036169105
MPFRTARATQFHGPAVELATHAQAERVLCAGNSAGMGQRVLDLGMQDAGWQPQARVLGVDLEMDVAIQGQPDDV